MKIQKKIWFIGCLLLCLLISGCHVEGVKDHDAKVNEQETQTSDKTIEDEKKAEEIKKEAASSQEKVNEEPSLSQTSNEEASNATKQMTPSSSNAPSNSASSSSSKVNQQEPTQTAPKPVPEQKTAYVTISIDVKTILSNMDQMKENKRSYVPSDGWILYPTKIELQEGDTVFTVLERVTRRNRIAMEYQGSSANAYNTAYIQGIQQIYEFDCGNLSGWMYFMNGGYVSVGASAKSVSDGDVIEWRYTCNSGNDLR